MAWVLRSSSKSIAPVNVEGIGGCEPRGLPLFAGWFGLGRGGGCCSLSLSLAAGHIQRCGDSAWCSSLVLGDGCSRSRMRDSIRFPQPPGNRCLDSRGCGLDPVAVSCKPGQYFLAGYAELLGQLVYPRLTGHCLAPHRTHRIGAPFLISWTSQPVGQGVFRVPEEIDLPPLVAAYREIHQRWQQGIRTARPVSSEPMEAARVPA